MQREHDKHLGPIVFSPLFFVPAPPGWYALRVLRERPDETLEVMKLPVVAFGYGDYSQAAVGLPDGAHANTGHPYAPDGLIERYEGLQSPDGLVWTDDGLWRAYKNWEHFARSELREAEHAASLAE
ncbi:hypothetical protein CDEF62S_04671 [Castellaniella defragrans]